MPRIVAAQSPKDLNRAQALRPEKSLSITAPGFEDRLRQNGVLSHDDPYLRPPSNLDELARQLHRERIGSPVPSEGKYRIFKELAAEASNEREMGAAVERYLFKDGMEPGVIAEGYRAKLDKQWLDYPKSQGFNSGLSNPKPDYVEGYRRSMFPPNISDLGGALTLDNKAPNFIALPHFAAEYKGRDSSLHSAKVQAGYNGAASERARTPLDTCPSALEPAFWRFLTNLTRPSSQCRTAAVSQYSISEVPTHLRMLL